MVSFAKLSSNVLKAATSASKKVETALNKAKPFTEKCRTNLKAALEVALGSLDGLEGRLELHIITTLSLKEMEGLLSGAKSDVKNVGALHCVNIISPRPDQTEDQSDSTVLTSKIFSDELELESHLRSALLCQPGEYPTIKLEVCDEETGYILSLDLQPSSVHTEQEEEVVEVSELVKGRSGGAVPHLLRADTTVSRAGLCQSLLTGTPLLARPTSATFLSQKEREENTSKVSDLHSELSSQEGSLVLRSAAHHSGLHILTPCSQLSRPPTFLLTEALTAADLLPFPYPYIEDTEDNKDTEVTEVADDMEDSDEDFDVKEALGRLPHYSQYEPSLLSSRRATRSGQVRKRAEAKAEKEEKPKVEKEIKMDLADTEEKQEKQ